ncbi:MAG TPA: hypothetical protein PKG52_05965 [bacterium]|nr:hypothetical protein [bacterium]HPS30072.1 hypothetical protein [bacterium]
MKKLFLVIITIFLFFSINANDYDKEYLTLKYQGVAIGQISLAYRLISLSTSLAIAKAVDKEYIFSLLSNVDSTILNCKNIITNNNGTPDNLSKHLLEGIDSLVQCSKNVKDYTSLQSYDNLNKVRGCIDKSSENIDKLTDEYNKTSSLFKDKVKNK